MGLFCINIEFLTVCSLFTTEAGEILQRNITRDSLDHYLSCDKSHATIESDGKVEKKKLEKIDKQVHRSQSSSLKVQC